MFKITETAAQQRAPFKNTIVTVTFPHMGSNGTLDYISHLTYNHTLIYDSRNDKTTKRNYFNRNTVTVKFLFNWYGTQQGVPQKFQKQMGEIFQPTFAKVTDMVTEPAFKTDWEYLEHMIKSADWTSWASDDGGVALAGEAHIQRLCDICHELFKTNKDRYLATVRPLVLKGASHGQHLLDEVWLANA